MVQYVVNKQEGGPDSEGGVNNSLSVSYIVTIPNDEVEQEINLNLDGYRQNYRVNGFRKGKAPLEMIKKDLQANSSERWQEIRVEAARSLIAKIFDDFQKKENVRASGDPNISSVNFDEGRGLSYTMTFDLYPTIPEIDFDNCAIDIYNVAIDDSDIESHKADVLSNSYHEVDQDEYAADNGDKVDIAFVGRVGGKEFDGGKSDNFPLVLGSGAVIPGIEEQIVGMKVGETRLIKTVFPAGYHMVDVAGKPVEFDITLKGLKSKYRDEKKFLKDMYQDKKDQMIADVKSMLERFTTDLKDSIHKRNLFDWIDSKYDFELPESSLDAERKALSGTGYSDMVIESLARRRVKMSFVVSYVSEKNDIKVDDSDFRKVLGIRLSGLDRKQQEARMRDRNFVASISAEALEETTVKFILDKVSKNEVGISVKGLKELFESIDDVKESNDEGKDSSSDSGVDSSDAVGDTDSGVQDAEIIDDK